MKRPTLLAALAALLAVPSPVAAEVPDDKTERVKEYTDRALEFIPEGSASYSIKRGTRPISDLDLATSSADTGLEAVVRRKMTRGRLYRAEIGALALPAGIVLGIDNFFGQSAFERKYPDTDKPNFTLPPSRFAAFAADDWRGYMLSAAGTALALYGAWQLGELIGEGLGLLRPRYLRQDTAKAAVTAYNKHLVLELGLQASDVATVAVAAGAASPSPTPEPVPEDFPAGEEGSGAWALRKATLAVRGVLGPDWAPYLAYTHDIRDFKPGLVKEGDWHVVLAATGSVKAQDVDVTVPRFGGGPTWRDSGPEWTPWRGGTDLLTKFKVDSPQALEKLEEPYLARQVGWLRPGATVVLYPFYYRLKEPVWVVFPGDNRFAPDTGVEAHHGTLVSLPRFRQ
jgi:hypothetical protein